MFGFVSLPQANPPPQLQLTTASPQRKTLDIITLFHKASTPASTRAVNLLKQASTNASQAANETPSPPSAREPFELDITEKPPTADQVETILEYVGKSEIPRVVSGATSVSDALRKFKMDKESFVRPVVSFWFLRCGWEREGCVAGCVANWCRLLIGVTARLLSGRRSPRSSSC